MNYSMCTGGVSVSSGTEGRQTAPPWLWAVLSGCLFFWGAALYAQEGSPPGTAVVWNLSPDEAVDLAIKNNLGLESTRSGVNTKKRKADHAWNVFIPTVDLSGTLALPNVATTAEGMQPVAIPGIPGLYGVVPYSVEVHQWAATGSLQLSLNLNVALFEGMKKLQLEYEEGLISYEKARAQLERDVRKSYYQMLLVEEQIGLLRESYTAAERRVALAEANYRAGRAPELTLLQARVAMENMKPTIDQAENGLKMAYASFAMNLGLPYNTRFSLVPREGALTAIPLDLQELISQASSGKPDLQELRQKVRVMDSTRKSTFLQLYTPTLSLGWNFDPTFMGDPFKDSWFKEDGWKQRSGMFRLTLAFRLNSLLPFGSEAQGLRELDDGLRTLNIGLAQAVWGTELEVYNTVLSLEKIRTTIEAQNLTVDLAERTYRLTEAAYRAGLNDLLEVQNAELELRRARNGVSEQHYNYLMGLIDLEYAIGVPFGTLLGRNQ